MTTMASLPQGRPLTRADLESVPDDGHRYELVDGALVVTPAPSPRHQWVVTRLLALLVEGCPNDLMVFAASLDVALDETTNMQPDLLVARRSDLTDRNLAAPPQLAVEVLSPSTRLIDLNLKHARYAAAGCPAYWVIDPDGPSLLAWELLDGRYTEVAHVRDDDTFLATLPFDIAVTPARLLD